VLSWNVEGLKKCLDDQDFVNFITNFDLLFFSETWERENSNFSIEGYVKCSVPRKASLKSKRGHGGVCLFYKNSVQNGVEIIQTNENGFICVKLSKLFFQFEKDIYICFAYIPPSNSPYYNLPETDFFEYIEQQVRRYSDLGFVSVIGDLNARCGEHPDVLLGSEEYEPYIDVVDNDNSSYISFELPKRYTMDKSVNNSGRKLLDLCICSNVKIVNGRLGEDAGIGNYTNMSANGNSLIDYVICSQDLFPFISNFRVHDSQTCSTHVPIEVCIKTKYTYLNDFNLCTTKVDKLVWNSEKVPEFKDKIQTELEKFEKLIDEIESKFVNVDEGVDMLSTLLYEKAFDTFGKTTTNNKKIPNRKFTSLWYNHECENARKEFSSATRTYKNNRSPNNRKILLASRKKYRSVKRKSEANFKRQEKNKLHNFAKNQPQKFWKEIKKLKKNKTDIGDITIEEFYDHFKDLYSNNDVFLNNQVDEELSNNLNQNIVEELDKDFTLEDVLTAISSLKTGKSGGEDRLISEIFKECKDLLSPALCRLFNFMLATTTYPESWSKGIIIPVPKKGDINDINNYRGITLTSIFSKIFSIMIDNRLRKWAESNRLLSDYQFGFRKGKSTIDCIFVLTSIINHVICNERKTLYCTFVDFRKAFDLVYRDGIWLKLLRSGCSSKIINMLQSMYSQVKSCVKLNGIKSEYFNSLMGVKQGEPLSPFLFIFFINDMYNCLYNQNVEMFNLDDINLFMLLFADDTVLFSYTKEGLQTLLDNLYTYCSEWGVTVNTDKTVVMVCKKGNAPLTDFDFYFNGHKLKYVNKFTYLGVTISSNGCSNQAQLALSKQAMKALFSLNSLFDIVQMHISEKLKLFESMVSPILFYGSEVWGFHKARNVEGVYLKFLKQILNVRQQTTNSSVYGELGLFPLHVIRNVRIVKYWFKIIKNPDSLMYKLYFMKNAHGMFVNEWTVNLKKLLDNLGFAYLLNSNDIEYQQLNSVIQRIYDQYIQQWFSEIGTLNKLESYRLFKDSFTCEKYLSCVDNTKYRVALTRFRCSAHKLLIEEGRYRNIIREERICRLCNMNLVESEYHFLLVCPLYRELRRICLPQYYCSWPNIQKFSQLLKTKQTTLLNKIGKYIYEASLLRENALN
jgi:exonuclease III